MWRAIARNGTSRCRRAYSTMRLTTPAPRPPGVGAPPGLVGRRPAEHDAVDPRELARDLRARGDTAVDDDFELGKIALQLMHVVILERRHLAVLLGRETPQHGIARMHDERAATGLRHGADEVAHEAIVAHLVDADAVLHRHRQRHRIADRPHAARDELGLRHQAGAEGAAVPARARAADVEVDLVVAVARAEARAMEQLFRLAATELQRDRMFLDAERKVAIDIAVDEGAGRDHLG